MTGNPYADLAELELARGRARQDTIELAAAVAPIAAPRRTLAELVDTVAEHALRLSPVLDRLNRTGRPTA